VVVDDVGNVLRELLPCCLALLRPNVLFVNHHTHGACRARQHEISTQRW
jgi:hypothetical protein